MRRKWTGIVSFGLLFLIAVGSLIFTDYKLNTENTKLKQELSTLSTRLGNQNVILSQQLQDNDKLIKEVDALKDDNLGQKALIGDLQEKVTLLEGLTNKRPSVSRGDSSVLNWEPFVATFYDNYGHTASGRMVQPNVTLAVDPRVIPLGTWLQIAWRDPNTGKLIIEKRRADDTGAAIKGRIVDIYVPNCGAYPGGGGRQKVYIRILK